MKSAPKSRSQIVYNSQPNSYTVGKSKAQSFGQFLEDLSEEDDFDSSEDGTLSDSNAKSKKDKVRSNSLGPTVTSEKQKKLKSAEKSNSANYNQWMANTKPRPSALNQPNDRFFLSNSKLKDKAAHLQVQSRQNQMRQSSFSDVLRRSVGINRPNNRSNSPNKKFFDLIVGFMKSSSNSGSKENQNSNQRRLTNNSEESVRVSKTEEKQNDEEVKTSKYNLRKSSLFRKYMKGNSKTPNRPLYNLSNIQPFTYDAVKMPKGQSTNISPIHNKRSS